MEKSNEPITQLSVTLPTQAFINGRYAPSSGTDKLVIRSAVDDSLVTDALECATVVDVDAAVQSAEEALPAWCAKSPEAKRDAMLRFADLIIEHGHDLGYSDTIVTGKPTLLSTNLEAHSAAEIFRYYAGCTDKLSGESLPADSEGFMRFVRYEPFGVCAAINAYNAPLATFAMKCAPAIAAGNVVVTKASEMNPFSTLLAAKLAVEAGIPPGVLNVVVGSAEAGEALSHHMRVRKISFTGSVNVGRKIQMASARSNLKKVTLELGGKSPTIIFDDADVDSAIAEISQGTLMISGQGCIFGMRMYAHFSVAEKFVAGLKARYEAYGATLSDRSGGSLASPVFHQNQFNTVLNFIERGKSEAQLITGGARHGTKGCFVEPTIFFKPIPEAEIMRQEIFGPVICIDTFETEEEVVLKANDSEYGLGAYLYSKDINRVMRIVPQIQAGVIGVNTNNVHSKVAPFGGYKQSGTGRENGIYALKEFLQSKSVHIKYSNSQ